MNHTTLATLTAAGAFGLVLILSLVSGNRGGAGRDIRGREIVQAAANRLSYGQISDAWIQIRLGNAGPLNEIRHGVALRYRATHQEGDAVILSFAGRSRRCIDLVSRPDANTVQTRRC